MINAEHEEKASEKSEIVISPLSCSLIGETQIINISPDTLAYKIYGKTKAKERFNCRYGFNEAYHKELYKRGLNIVGVDDNGDARIVEISDHQFFIATLFLPQASSSVEKPHPLILEYLKAAKSFQVIKKTGKIGMA